MERRGDLVHAALTLIANWVAHGQPPGERSLGMFESWAEVVGGVLLAAGIPGFLSNLENLYEQADAEGDEWCRFVGGWWAQHYGHLITAKDLFQLAEETLDLGNGSERSRHTILGQKLKKMRDRIFDGYQITRGETKQHAQQWRLVSVRR